MTLNKLAELFSDIFNPYYASIPLFLLVALASTRNHLYAVLYWAILVVFFSALPMWDIKRRAKLGMVSDVHIDKREDRIKPFLFTLGCTIAGLAVIYLIHAPALIKAVSLSIVCIGAVITVITLKWKISLHAAGITSVSLILFLIYGVWAVPIFLCVPAVIWARLYLKRHTVSQIIAGTAVSIAVVLGFFSVFGLR